ncbi:uncharacterized protein LOC112562508 [Pomacea canaliculata]|uniref:uncharacterized protein LOC112562508 n=1 Tax=Pomacea canaliculata TaxID=400727 RepID=UPI000D726F85|nr:uncharacterized protein LOC112562508 [Pomacea canaliculata]
MKHTPRCRPTLCRKGLTVKGRPHFCNFVNQASLHHRFGRDHSRPFSGDSDFSRSRRSEANHDVGSHHWKNNGRLFRRQSGTQGRPGSPSSADDGHIRDDLDLLTDVTGGSTSTRRSGGTEVVNNKTIPTVNFPSTPSQQSEPPPGTFRRNLEESRKKSSKDDSTCKSSTSAKSKSSKSSSSRGSGKPLPADGQDEGGRDKRLNGAKKGKKCQDRHHSRKGAEGEGGNAPQTEETAETTKAAPEAGENLLEVNVKVPDLPHARSPKRDQGRSPGNKNERRLIPPPSEGRQMLPHELLDLNLYHLTGFDFGDMEASTADSSRKKQTSWMNDRMALSQQSSRFELPMDMKELERITPQEYLKTFCIVTSRRLNLYQKVFIKHKDRTNHLNKESLTQCLKEVLIEMLTEDTLSEVFQLVEISEETRIDFRLFSGIAALAERMLYPNYTTVDTMDKSEYQRAILETADFGNLTWKLDGVKVVEGTRKLLEAVNGCSTRT